MSQTTSNLSSSSSRKTQIRLRLNDDFRLFGLLLVVGAGDGLALPLRARRLGFGGLYGRRWWLSGSSLILSLLLLVGGSSRRRRIAVVVVVDVVAAIVVVMRRRSGRRRSRSGSEKRILLVVIIIVRGAEILQLWKRYGLENAGAGSCGVLCRNVDWSNKVKDQAIFDKDMRVVSALPMSAPVLEKDRERLRLRSDAV